MPAEAARVFTRARVSACAGAMLCACALLAGRTATAQVVDTLTVVSPVAGPADSVVVLSGANTAAGRAIARVLRSPHVVLDGGGRGVNIPRGTRFDSSVVVLSPRVTVGGNVGGHVLVIGGDLFTHPGGRIQGDAIAVGGGVYQSSLATVEGSVDAFRDETFLAEPRGSGTIALTHVSSRVEHETAVLTWPLRTGLRVPSYNRVDGVVVPWGPFVTLNRGRVLLDPTITYRSDLGNLDPALRASVELGSLRVTADARRATFSNDRWIRSDLINSLTTLWAGRDTRNYYRADRLELRVGAVLRPANVVLEPYAGARNELAWSTGGELSRSSHPWSLFGRDSIDGIFRPNPAVAHIRVVSTLAGIALRWNPEDVQLRLSADWERAWDRNLEFPAEGPVPEDSRFSQVTLHGTVAFPTFAGQRLFARVHAVTSTSGDRRPPPQRYAYLGGGGTLPTMDLLEQGGTELFHFATSYIIPISGITLPYLGSPVLTLRYLTGAAGVDELPRLTQNVGAGIGVRFVSIQFLIDPQTSEKEFGIGLTFGF